MEKPTNAVQEVIDIGENEKSADLVDGRNNRSRNNSKAISNDNYYYHTKKSVAEGTNMGLDQRWPSHGQNCGPSNSIDLVPLQSKFFPANFIFFCILEKGILAGKN
jgi:hypothetical protein